MSVVSPPPPPGKASVQVRMSPSAVAHDDTATSQPRRKKTGSPAILRPATPFNRAIDLPSSESDGEETGRPMQGDTSGQDGDVATAPTAEGATTSGARTPPSRHPRRRRASSGARSTAATSVVSSPSSHGSERTIRRIESAISSVRASSGLSDTETLLSDSEPFRSVTQPLHRQTSAGKLRSAMRPPKAYAAPSYSASQVSASDNWKPLPPSPPDAHRRRPLPPLEMPDWNAVSPHCQDSFTSLSSFDMSDLARDLPTPSPSSWEDRPQAFKEPMRWGSIGRGRLDMPRSRAGSGVSSASQHSGVQGILPSQCLDAYLRNAQIPKWEKWIDPDLLNGNEPRFVSSAHAFWNRRNYNSRVAEQRSQVSSGKAAVVSRLLNGPIKAAEESDFPEVTLRRWEVRRGFLESIAECELQRLPRRLAHTETSRRIDTRKNIPLLPIQEAHQWGEQ